jgi:hypothetical protein
MIIAGSPLKINERFHPSRKETAAGFSGGSCDFTF